MTPAEPAATAAEGDDQIAGKMLSELSWWDTPLVFVLDQELRRHLYLAGPIEAMLGLTREQLLANPDEWQRVLEPESRAVATTLRRDLEMHGQLMRVIRVKLPDGRVKTLRALLMARRFNGRSVVAGTVRECGFAAPADGLEEIYRLAVEQTHEGVAVTDAEGRYVSLNRKHLELFGYNKHDVLVGSSWRVFYTDEVVRHIEREVFPELAAKGVWRGRLKARRRDGTQFHEELTLSMLANGGIVCNCRDATAEVEMAERLKAAEDMFRTFLNTLPTGVMIRNLAGAYEFVNSATIDFLGREVRTRAGTDLDVCLSDHPAFARWGAADQRVAATGEAVCFDFPLAWGGRDWVLEVRKMPLRINSPAVTHVCTLVKDIAERQLLEAAKAEAAQRSRDYTEMQREFISMVSHEFRTPLTSIQGVHYLLEQKARQFEPATAADMKRLLDLQQRALSTLKELVDQVLLLNRLEHESRMTVPAPVPLAAFVQRVVDAMNVTLADNRIRATLDLPEGYEAAFDESQMRALLENLISNGLKYSEAAEPVAVTVRAADGAWVLEVADRGRGIPEHDQAKLFQPFHRASNVKQVQGTGLGLTIVQRVVHFHHGKLEFSSKVGVGTTFRLTFPQTFVPETSPSDKGLPFNR